MATKNSTLDLRIKSLGIDKFQYSR